MRHIFYENRYKIKIEGFTEGFEKYWENSIVVVIL